MFPPGVEPGTLRVWNARDNRYSTETLQGSLLLQYKRNITKML